MHVFCSYNKYINPLPLINTFLYLLIYMAYISALNPVFLLCFVSSLGKQHSYYPSVFCPVPRKGQLWDYLLDACMFSCPLILMFFPVFDQFDHF